MAIPRDFDKTLAAMDDREVFEIVARESDYTPEALEAARLELSRRKLSEESVIAFQSTVDVEVSSEAERANRPLPIAWRIVNFLLPFGLIQAVVASSLGTKGFTRCERECWFWMWRGLLAWVLVPILIGATIYIFPDLRSGGKIVVGAALLSIVLSIAISAAFVRIIAKK